MVDLTIIFLIYFAQNGYESLSFGIRSKQQKLNRNSCAVTIIIIIIIKMEIPIETPIKSIIIVFIGSIIAAPTHT